MSEVPYLEAGQVLLGLDAADKWAAIERLCEAVLTAPALAAGAWPLADLVQAVETRERERATGIDMGFAFPHARLHGLGRAVLAVARPRTPLAFGAPDGSAAQLIVLMVLPDDDPQLVLKVMSHVAKMAIDAPLRERLLATVDPDEIVAEFAMRLLDLDRPLLACDIMRPPVANIYPDTPLREVTRTLVEHNLDAISVVRRDMTLIGEITADRLFKAGMPDFFAHLKSVAFIREFDPFERYFPAERMASAADVMDTGFAAMPEDATLLEIVFALAVKRHAKVYVVRDGKRVGVIDRNVVLDKVIQA